jgi:hypothetical protein
MKNREKLFKIFTYRWVDHVSCSTLDIVCLHVLS